jgi:hypothetical protein
MMVHDSFFEKLTFDRVFKVFSDCYNLCDRRFIAVLTGSSLEPVVSSLHA